MYNLLYNIFGFELLLASRAGPLTGDSGHEDDMFANPHLKILAIA